MSVDLARSEKIGIRLLLGCILLWGVIWFYMAFLYEGTAEEEMWAPVAGFFMGLVLGGGLSIVPAIYAGSVLKQVESGSTKLKVVLVMSVIWFSAVCLIYLI